MDDACRAAAAGRPCARTVERIGTLEDQAVRHAPEMPLGGHEARPFREAGHNAGCRRAAYRSSRSAAGTLRGRARRTARRRRPWRHGHAECRHASCARSGGWHGGASRPDRSRGSSAPCEPERQIGSSRASRASVSGSPAVRIADDADAMAAGRLLAGQIADMAKEAADGRAQAMENAKPLICHRLRNSRRLRTQKNRS